METGLFFILAYATAWAFFLTAGATDIPELRSALFLVGAFMPALVALWLTAQTEGRAAAGALLRRVVAWRVDWRLYLLAAGYPAAIKLAVALVHRLAVGTWPRFDGPQWYLIILAIFAATPSKAGEEIGWRGYALPRLASRLGLRWSSVLLGAIWACWHLPQFFISGNDTSAQSFPVFLLEVTALSVVLAWLHARANGSVLLPMLLHSAVNESKDIVPSVVRGATTPLALSSSLVAWLTVLVLWMGAAYFLVRMPRWDAARIAAAI